MTPLATTIRHHRRRATTTTLIKLCLIALLTIALWLGSLMLGDSFYSLADVIGVLRGDTVPGASFTVGELRLPRATVAIVAGFAFGVSGSSSKPCCVTSWPHRTSSEFQLAQPLRAPP